MKDNEKRLCWSCDGDVSLHLTHCPYCGVELSKREGHMPYQSLGDPFQKAPKQEGVITEEEWADALDEKEEVASSDTGNRQEMIALLLLLPGAVFMLFGLLLILFSSEGVLTLRWNQSLAYFYFLGAVPMLFLGWRAMKS